MIYLACPYSHPDPEVRRARFEAVTAYAAAMFNAGIDVYSPITHSHPMALLGCGGKWEDWMLHDRKIMSICDVYVCLDLPGREESVGVREEHALAIEFGIPAYLADPANPAKTIRVLKGLEP